MLAIRPFDPQAGPEGGMTSTTIYCSPTTSSQTTTRVTITELEVFRQ